MTSLLLSFETSFYKSMGLRPQGGLRGLPIKVWTCLTSKSREQFDSIPNVSRELFEAPKIEGSRQETQNYVSSKANTVDCTSEFHSKDLQSGYSVVVGASEDKRSVLVKSFEIMFNRYIRLSSIYCDLSVALCILSAGSA